MKQKGLSKFQIGVFASGDLFGGGTAVIFSFFYLIFLTDVVGMQPLSAGTMFLIVKIYSIVATPLMGQITDNTRSKFGRRRPYFLAGFFGVFAAFFLMWNNVASDDQQVIFFYVLFANLFYATISAMVTVPYTCLNAEISEDPKERNHATGARMFVSQIASLIGALVPLELVKMFASASDGYRVMGLVFGLFFAVPFLLMFFFNKEAVEVTSPNKGIKLSEYIKPLKIKIFRDFSILYMLTFTVNGIISTIFAYYMKYYLQRPEELTYILGTMLVVQTVSIPLVVKLTDLIGKPKSFRFFSLVAIVGLIVVAFTSATSPVWLIYVAAAILGVGIGGCIVLMFSMFPDIADVGEYKTKERNSGTFSGVISLLRSFANMLTSYLIAVALQFSGYANPAKQEVNGVVTNVDQVQPDSFFFGLQIMIWVVPIALTFIAIWLSFSYKLENRVLESLRNKLRIQRGSQEEGLTLTAEEEAELERVIK